ncbi:MAG TPA: amidase [Edaphocola sp.]|nr:amidase [Edaphocola sp.]
MQNIIYSSAYEIVHKIVTQQISVEQVCVAFLTQIKRHNKELNAICELRNEDEILKDAREKDGLLKIGKSKGLLFGLPMTVKDTFWVKNLKNSNGDPLQINYIAKEDAELIKLLKEEGAIIIGKTNVPLFCIDWQTTNFWNGQTNNPYDISRVAGGSSGGSAVAVSVGFSPLELGSDAGGSIRVPAHFNGICGLRPTEDLLSNRGHIQAPNKPLGNRNIVTPGPLAKNVDDLILLMYVLTKNSLIPFGYTFDNQQKENELSLKNLKIAYSETINNTEIDNEYLEIFRDLIKKVKQKNDQITSDFPIYDEQKAYLEYGKVIGFEMGVNNPRIPFFSFFLYLFLLGKYRDPNWAKGMSIGQRASNYTYSKAIDYKNFVSKIYEDFLTEYDIWITPVCSIEAYKHQNAGKPFVINGKKIAYTKAIGSFTFTTAFSGHPIVVIPIGKMKNGMPVGIQIHSKKWSDKKLLLIAKLFESLTNGYEIPKNYCC